MEYLITIALVNSKITRGENHSTHIQAGTAWERKLCVCLGYNEEELCKFLYLTLLSDYNVFQGQEESK